MELVIFSSHSFATDIQVIGVSFTPRFERALASMATGVIPHISRYVIYTPDEPMVAT